MIAKYRNTVIREPEYTDLMLLFLWENTPAFQFQNGRNRKRYDLDTIKAHLENIHQVEKNGQMRMMVENLDKHTIGTVDLFDIDFSFLTAKVGVLIADKQYREQSHAFHAVGLIMEYASKKWQIKSFIAEVSKDNIPSLALFRKMLLHFEKAKDGSHAVQKQLDDKYIFHFELVRIHENFTIFE
ncbi:MAG: GNAT family N-acetyltransferase [Crocinitomicaceae bacterium]|nr:GNAT family N-acetyltransferase [Crocinitomicaceae bacterium]